MFSTHACKNKADALLTRCKTLTAITASMGEKEDALVGQWCVETFKMAMLFNQVLATLTTRVSLQ